jgi:hypothetical protein
MSGDSCHARISGPADDLGELSSDNGDAPFDHIPERRSNAELADCHGLIVSVMRITFRWCS